jgi:predicted HTH domain antitoxin
VVLSAISPFFKTLLLENPCRHPVVILPQEVAFNDLQILIDFVYRGEVDVPKDSLDSVLRAASQLRIEGLCEGQSSIKIVDPATVAADDEVAAVVDGVDECFMSAAAATRHMSKRKKRKSSSPKHRVSSIKSKRKSLKPMRYEEVESECAAEKVKSGTQQNDVENDVMPVDFTVRRRKEGGEAAEDGCRSPPIDVVSMDEAKVDNGAWSLYHRNTATAASLLLNEEAAAAAALNLTSIPPAASPSHSTDPSFFGHYRMVAAAAAAAATMQSPNFPMLSSSYTTTGSTISAAQEQRTSEPDCDSYSNKSDERSPSSTSEVHKTYTKKDMFRALEALKTKRMSLSRASELYGIPATTLWQRANRLGITTPKKESTTTSTSAAATTVSSKSWSEADLNSALDALRKKEISANKAAKVYGIPSSTLYKIARKEKIELAQPFNAVQTTWTQEDLDSSLEAIRKGMPVQKAASEFGIPSGTLYGRCKKVGIELSKTTAVHWSEVDMNKALENVRTGGMSINQAAMHHNLPYSSLYGRINRLKRDNPNDWAGFTGDLSLDAFMAATASAGSEQSASAAAAAFAAVGSSAFHPFSLPTLLERDGSRKPFEDVARMDDHDESRNSRNRSPPTHRTRAAAASLN